MSPKHHLTFLACLLFLLSGNVRSHALAGALKLDSDIGDLVRIADLPIVVDQDPMIEKYILDYTTRGRNETAKLLGRGLEHFPTFSDYLRAQGLPEGLKYLPMVESGLQGDAISPAGAGGWWQFMPATARYYGLTVSDSLDERTDIHLSSQAAAKMLADLHRQFCDWRLALAAYNCGPGRVKKAIRRMGTSEYSELKSALPTQTQHYIAKFIAATYVANHYVAHQIQPFLSSPQKVETHNEKVRTHTKAASILPLPRKMIRQVTIDNAQWAGLVRIPFKFPTVQATDQGQQHTDVREMPSTKGIELATTGTVDSVLVPAAWRELPVTTIPYGPSNTKEETIPTWMTLIRRSFLVIYVGFGP